MATPEITETYDPVTGVTTLAVKLNGQALLNLEKLRGLVGFDTLEETIKAALLVQLRKIPTPEPMRFTDQQTDLAKDEQPGSDFDFTSLSKDKLIIRVIDVLNKPVIDPTRGYRLLWSRVGEVFNLGSTSASLLCVHYGYDPSRRVARK